MCSDSCRCVATLSNALLGRTSTDISCRVILGRVKECCVQCATVSRGNHPTRCPLSIEVLSARTPIVGVSGTTADTGMNRSFAITGMAIASGCSTLRGLSMCYVMATPSNGGRSIGLNNDCMPAMTNGCAVACVTISAANGVAATSCIIGIG